ncbi:signal peptidase, partial [Cardiosporidium cionae]
LFAFVYFINKEETHLFFFAFTVNIFYCFFILIVFFMPKSTVVPAVAAVAPLEEIIPAGKGSLLSRAKQCMLSPFQSIAIELQIVKSRPIEHLQRFVGIFYVLLSSFMVWKAIMVLANTPSPVVVVLSGSMEPAFQRGDILFLTHLSPPVAGDVIVFQLEGRNIPIVHRILSIHRNETGSFILTKGDNNHVDDRGLYPEGQDWLSDKEILGKASGFLPYVGMFTIWLNDYPLAKYSLLTGTITMMLMGYS